jgi:hypothetical protein
MQLNENNLSLFSDEHKQILNKLNMKNSKGYTLNGSYPHSLWASDLDLFQVIESLAVDGSQIVKEIKSKVKTLVSDEDSQFVELKIGDTKFKTPSAVYKLTYKQLFNSLTTSENQRIKLDTFTFVKGYIEDITIIYDLHQKNSVMTNEEFEGAMIEDAEKFYKKKNYFKVLKRTNTLFTSMNYEEDLPNRYVSLYKAVKEALNNSTNGFIYLTMARLESARDASQIPMKMREEALGNLREDIGIKLGSLYPVLRKYAKNLTLRSTTEVIVKLYKILNSRVKPLIQRLGNTLYTF